MVDVSKNILDQLASVIGNLSNEEYTQKLDLFSGTSIGQHTRHILEFYTCLISKSECDCICYDDRERNTELEENSSSALSKIDSIKTDLQSLNNNKALTLKALMGSKIVDVNTSFERELLYAIEHTVHHMAIIKMGLLMNFHHVIIPENFGVAESTIAYRNQCAQ